jgi:arylsulfatase A-like enzyme
MKRMKQGAALLALAAAMLLASQPAVVAQATRPNIVVFLIDDYDIGSLMLLVQKGLMPNLKKYFLDAGYNFVESFSVASWGASSRATFLTGQYPHNHGVLANFPPSGGAALLNDRSTIATWLKTAGYRTGFVGRYLTGYGLWTDASQVPPGWDEWFGLVDPSSLSTSDYSISINGTVIDIGQIAVQQGTELYQTDVLSYAAGTVIERSIAARRPWFLTVAPLAFNLELPLYSECPNPSDPSGLGGNIWSFTQRPALRHAGTIFGNEIEFPLPIKPSFDEADVDDKPEWVRSRPRLAAEDADCLKKRYWRQLEVMRAVDDQVGYVMGIIENAGALSNTVAIFTGDNGWNGGEHRLPFKGYAYEETIRVPLIVRPTGLVQPREIRQLVLNTDLAPTIAQLAQARPTHSVDGRSLVPLALDPLAAWRTVAMLEHVADEGYFGDPNPPSYFGLRTDASRPRTYVQYQSGIDGELYDLDLDRYQLQNLYADPQRQVERDRLNSWLDAMKGCAGLTCYLLESYFTFTN